MEMTPEQALDNLDTIVSEYRGTRQQHMLLQKSVAVLRAVLAARAAPNGVALTRDDERL